MKQHTGFTGLPDDVTLDALKHRTAIADDIAGAFNNARNSADEMRRRMEDGGILRRFEHPETTAATVCGIAGCGAAAGMAGMTVYCAGAFAVEGLVPADVTPLLERPLSSVWFDHGPDNRSAALLTKAIGLERQVALTTRVSHTMILLNGSQVETAAGILTSVLPALREKNTVAGREFLAGLKQTVPLMERLFDIREGSSICVGIGGTPRGEYARLLKWDTPVRDDALLGFVLKPGEYTRPCPVDPATPERVKSMRVPDDSFRAIAHRIADKAASIHVFYARPFDWTPAVRIELPKAAAEDVSLLDGVLGAVAAQFGAPGGGGIYPVVTATAMARSLREALPACIDTARTETLRILEDDMGKLLPLVMDNGSHTGDHYE